MDIAFRTRKLGKTFNEAATLRKTYGEPMAKAIQRRMAVLRNAENLVLVPTTKPERRHQLSANREGTFAVDLIQPYRLVFEPNHEPIPRTDDGGIDTERVTAIKILDVIDYH